LQSVLVIDSFSSDDTCEIARGFPNVRIIQRHFDTHTAQWNFGLSQADTDWVLSLDADYEVSGELASEIQALSPQEDLVGYSARFEFRIFGKKLRSSVYPPRTVLFRRSRAAYHDDGHTQKLHVGGATKLLGAVIYHDDRKSLSRWIRSQDRYALIEARHLLSTPKAGLSLQDRLRLRIYFAPLVMLAYLLLGRGLILDGWQGWYYVFQRSIAEMLLSLRLLTEKWALERDE
jgi:glycosyltransferase involved in cell wall biosynthesis